MPCSRKLGMFDRIAPLTPFVWAATMNSLHANHVVVLVSCFLISCFLMEVN